MRYIRQIAFFQLLAFVAVLCCPVAGLATDASDPTAELTDKSLEELMNIDVTSVSRKEQKLSRVPAAVYVVTREAIERSGANTIPDLLRIVPGVQVVQVEANRWAISVRGFNGIYSNKLLVLVDGRTVYTPSFSGVYWDQLFELPMDTIERIEVVRGPGAAVWGANAVNGVINIITRRPEATQGVHVRTGGGSDQVGGYEAMYGGKSSALGSYRFFGGFSSFGSHLTTEGTNAHDAWRVEHGGFRFDRQLSSRDSLFVQGNGYQEHGSELAARFLGGAIGELPNAIGNSGGDITARLTRRHSDTSDSSLQIYDSNYSRSDTNLNEHSQTLDFDFQNHSQIGNRNDVVWGAGYRLTTDSAVPILGAESALSTFGYFPQIAPAKRTYSLYSAFFQDEITLPGNLALTAGTKLEHNAFGGFEFEPSVRLSWALAESSTAWFAASQAARQPSRLENGLALQWAPLTLAPHVSLDAYSSGNEKLHDEQVRDYEAGYRFMPRNQVSVDVTAFWSRYSKLLGNTILSPSAQFEPDGLHIYGPFRYDNLLSARSYGAELAVSWRVRPRWRLEGTSSWLRTAVSSQPPLSPEVAANPLVTALTPQLFESFAALFSPVGSANYGISPRFHGGVESFFDLDSKTHFDDSIYFVGSTLGYPGSSYARIDARLSRKVSRFAELSIAGQNLSHAEHIEQGNGSQLLSTQIPRSVFGSVAWTF